MTVGMMMNLHFTRNRYRREVQLVNDGFQARFRIVCASQGL